jgi:hypothetical protein
MSDGLQSRTEGTHEYINAASSGLVSEHVIQNFKKRKAQCDEDEGDSDASPGASARMSPFKHIVNNRGQMQRDSRASRDVPVLLPDPVPSVLLASAQLRPAKGCPHGRRKDRCKECGGGSSFCAHGRRRWECRDCGGTSICPHNRRRSRCRDCGGTSICLHGREKWNCRECCGSASLCAHGRQRSRCRKCGGPCRHGRRRRDCAECERTAFSAVLAAGTHGCAAALCVPAAPVCAGPTSYPDSSFQLAPVAQEDYPRHQTPSGMLASLLAPRLEWLLLPHLVLPLPPLHSRPPPPSVHRFSPATAIPPSPPPQAPPSLPPPPSPWLAPAAAAAADFGKAVAVGSAASAFSPWRPPERGPLRTFALSTAEGSLLAREGGGSGGRLTKAPPPHHAEST